VCKAVQQVKVK